MQQFKHTLPIQLRFNDIDALGHVNNTVYFSFYDLGKTSYFSQIRDANESLVDIVDFGVVIANIQVNFVLPIFPNEKIAVQTAVSEVGTKSFKLIQQVINVETNDVKCVCQTVMVGYNLTSKTTQEISEEWKKALADFEGNPSILK